MGTIFGDGQTLAMPIKKFGGLDIVHHAMGIEWAFFFYNFIYFL